jgi:uncharacterized damage-inducible protein DinB
MGNRESLLHSLDYDFWANLESLRSVEAAANAPERSLAVIAHIPAAARVWLERVRKTGKPVAVWPGWTLEETEREIRATAREWRELLTSAELASKIPYANSKGERFENTVDEAATHVLFHGAYHRGQIATLLRGSGAVPALTDYIHYVRTVRPAAAA